MSDCTSGSECCGFCGPKSFMPFAGVQFNPDFKALLGGQQPIVPTLQSAADCNDAGSGCGCADCTMVPLAISLANVGRMGALSDAVAPIFSGF